MVKGSRFNDELRYGAPPSTNGLLPRPIEDARNEVYHLVDQIHGESLRFRRDIAGNHDFALNKAVTI